MDAETHESLGREWALVLGTSRMTERVQEQTEERARTGEAATAGVPIVQAIEVSRRYGEGDAAVDALRDVSVEFERDRFTAIMGPFASGLKV